MLSWKVRLIYLACVVLTVFAAVDGGLHWRRT